MRYLLCLAALLFSTSAFAQKSKATPKRTIIRGDPVVVDGRPPKPQAFYILQRSSLNFRKTQLKNSFMPKIVRSVERAPF